jgi:hypothetical protein
VVELFVVANFAFLGGDIAIAHMANRFADPVEWAPIAFSALAMPLLLPGLLRIGPPRVTRWIDLCVASCAILVGILGMLFHLRNGFFVESTLHRLVYAAPFAAPLAYVGVGLLAILVRMERPGSPAFGPWVVMLALGGFVGNFALSVLDHAQNGFFSRAEWIPVVAAAFGASFLLLAVLRPDPAFLRLCFWVCGAEAVVGLLGFALHLIPEGSSPTVSLVDRLVFGAPVFAPLLFTNMALLASIGLWATLRALPRSEAIPAPASA